jgi:hypothetical protein
MLQRKQFRPDTKVIALDANDKQYDVVDVNGLAICILNIAEPEKVSLTKKEES